MKKAMKQSKLIAILNGISILALILMIVLLVSNSNVNQKLNNDSEARKRHGQRSGGKT